MKYQGQNPRKCDCHYCTGDNNSKAVHKSTKHGARQKDKKEVRNAIRDIVKRGKKEIL